MHEEVTAISDSFSNNDANLIKGRSKRKIKKREETKKEYQISYFRDWILFQRALISRKPVWTLWDSHSPLIFQRVHYFLYLTFNFLPREFNSPMIMRLWNFLPSGMFQIFFFPSIPPSKESNRDNTSGENFSVDEMYEI